MFRTSLLMLALLFPAIAGCSDADTTIDCNAICNRYKDCFDANYNADSCATECQNDAKDDRDFRDKADACHNCIDDRSCGGTVFSCTTECVGVVP
jgi:hypothetical protein